MRILTEKYFIGIIWFILSLLFSALNDISAKYLGLRLHSFEISFFRFLFSVITLLPFIIYYGFNILESNHPYIHIIRGTLLFCAITSWIFGLTIVPVTTVTIISFSIPLFVLILAIFFLKESITWNRWVITIIGFIGIVITLKPTSQSFNYQTLILIIAAIAFASLDIINKKFIIKESMLSMLFYSALVTTVLACPLAIMHWKTPNLHELFLLLFLGANANLILFFLLKAFTLIDATAAAPYRYLELIITASAAYLIFNEIPQKHTYYGALIIVPTTLYATYVENKASDEKANYRKVQQKVYNE